MSTSSITWSAPGRVDGGSRGSVSAVTGGSADLLEHGRLDLLVVRPDAGRRGVGRLLVAGVQHAAARAGLRTLSTHASRSAPVLERCGFRVVRPRPTT